MQQRNLTAEQVIDFAHYLRQEEKSKATIEKYVHDVGVFCQFVGAGK